MKHLSGTKLIYNASHSLFTIYGVGFAISFATNFILNMAKVFSGLHLIYRRDRDHYKLNLTQLACTCI